MPTSADIFRQLALGFPEASEEPHFDKTSFRVRKKIFATLDVNHHRACMKLTAVDQEVFTRIGRDIISPVAGHWGAQGWTYIDLDKADTDILKDMMTTAFCTVAPKKLAEQVRTDSPK